MWRVQPISKSYGRYWRYDEFEETDFVNSIPITNFPLYRDANN